MLEGRPGNNSQSNIIVLATFLNKAQRSTVVYKADVLIYSCMIFSDKE